MGHADIVQTTARTACTIVPSTPTFVQEESRIEFANSGKGELDVLLLGGLPTDETIVQYGEVAGQVIDRKSVV